MATLTTRRAAKELGLGHVALSHYIKIGKVPAPQIVTAGNFRVHLWSGEDVERVRELLPKIKNGRKTRYTKKQLAVGSQQLAKAKTKKKQPQPRAAEPHKQNQTRKSKP